VSVTSRHRLRAIPLIWLKALAVILLVAAGATLLLAYVHSYACIAEQEFTRQRLHQDIAQLRRDNIALNLDLDRLTAQAHLTEMAKNQGLEIPTVDRVHYVRVPSDMNQSGVAQARVSSPPSWVARSGRHVLAAMGHTVERLSRGPGDPAYAQD